MFDIGWTELVVVGCVAILVVGPKELPGMLRTFGKTVGNLRRMAGDFQRQFNDALKEAEIDEMKKTVAFDPLEDARKSAQAFQESLKKTVDETEEGAEIKMPEMEATTAAKARADAKGASAKFETAKTIQDSKAAKPAASKTSASKPKAAAKKTASARPASSKTASAKPASKKPASSKSKSAKP